MRRSRRREVKLGLEPDVHVDIATGMPCPEDHSCEVPNVTFCPPSQLKYSLPLTAIEEEMRMDELGVRFLCHDRCFHYLVPLGQCDETEKTATGGASFVLLSYLYHPITKVIARCQKTLIADEAAWERRAREVGRQLSDEDGNQLLWE